MPSRLRSRALDSVSALPSALLGVALALGATAGCMPEKLEFVPDAAGGAGGSGGASGGSAGSQAGAGNAGTAGEAGQAGAGGSLAGAAGMGPGGAAGDAGQAGAAGAGASGAAGSAGGGGDAGQAGGGAAGAGGTQAGAGGEGGEAGAAGDAGAAGQAGEAGAGGAVVGGGGGGGGAGGGGGGASGAGGGGGATCTAQFCQGDDVYACTNGVPSFVTSCPLGCAKVLGSCNTVCRADTLTCNDALSFTKCTATGNGFTNGSCPTGTVCNDALDSCTACATDADCQGDDVLASRSLTAACLTNLPICRADGTCSSPGPGDVVPAGTDVTPAGDCKRRVCNGAGNGALVNDDTDQPAGDRCAPNMVCKSGALLPTPKLRGAVCNGGAGRCDGISACVGAPSCAGMSAGPVARGAEVCAMAKVTGGSFDLNRGQTLSPTTLIAPHTVSDFWMDRYEVTVGRFRRFLAAYDSWRASGQPKPMGGYDSALHPYEGHDPCVGWDEHDYLPGCAASLEHRVSTLSGTWTPTPETTAGGYPLDERPLVGGIPWALARAFCLWDGGRLATYAEHAYVRVQGADHRDVPWLAAPTTMTSAKPTDACWSGSMGTNPVVSGGTGEVVGYGKPCLVGGLCASGTSNDVIANRADPGFGANRYRDIAIGVNATPIYDLAGSGTEWVLDAAIGFPDNDTPCVDCVRSNPWTSTAGRITVGYSWLETLDSSTSVAWKRQGDGLCAEGTITMGFRCVYTDRGDEEPLAPAACVTSHTSTDPLGAADCDGSSTATYCP